MFLNNDTQLLIFFLFTHSIRFLNGEHFILDDVRGAKLTQFLSLIHFELQLIVFHTLLFLQLINLLIYLYSHICERDDE